MTKKKTGLQEGFELMLADVIIPGIIHNFANPLNGIVGRARLLKRKIDEKLKSGEDFGDRDFCKMTSNDVGLICREADRLSGLLLVISEKFYALNNVYSQKINLSRLLETEVKFQDFNLDFKHNIEKSISLDNDVPDIKGIAAEFSFCFGSIFQDVIIRALAGQCKKLYLRSFLRDDLIVVEFKWGGTVQNSAFKDFTGYQAIVPVFERYGISFTQEHEGEFQVLSLMVPTARE